MKLIKWNIVCLSLLVFLSPITSISVAQTDNDYLYELQNLPTLPKLTFFWPPPNNWVEDQQNEQVMSEYIRILNGWTIPLYAPNEVVTKVMNHKPRVLTVLVQPFSKHSLSPTLTGFTFEEAANDGDKEEYHIQQLKSYAELLRQEIGSRQWVILYFDHELWHVDNLDATTRDIVTSKLQRAVDAVKSSLPKSIIIWYNWGQHTSKRISCPINYDDLRSYTAHHSEYYSPLSLLNWIRRIATANYWRDHGKRLTVAISLGCEWGIPQSPGITNRFLCMTCEPQLGETWQHAYEIYQLEYDILFIKIWPGPGRPNFPEGVFIKHFIAHALGARGIELDYCWWE